MEDIKIFLEQETEKFLNKLSERPEVASAMSTYSERFPKYRVDVDAAQSR